MRILSLVLVCFSMLILCGCTALERDAFYSPGTAEKSDFTVRQPASGSDYIFLGSTPHIIDLHLIDVQVSVRVTTSFYEHGWFGPLCFPVFPDVFTRKEMQVIDALHVNVVINPQKDIDVDLKQLAILQIQRGQKGIPFSNIQYYPLRPMCPPLSTEKPIHIAAGQTACFNLIFPLPRPQELSEFSVLIGGIFIGEVSMDSVRIDFQKKRAWTLYQAP